MFSKPLHKTHRPCALQAPLPADHPAHPAVLLIQDDVVQKIVAALRQDDSFLGIMRLSVTCKKLYEIIHSEYFLQQFADPKYSDVHGLEGWESPGRSRIRDANIQKGYCQLSDEIYGHGKRRAFAHCDKFYNTSVIASMSGCIKDTQIIVEEYYHTPEDCAAQDACAKVIFRPLELTAAEHCSELILSDTPLTSSANLSMQRFQQEKWLCFLNDAGALVAVNRLDQTQTVFAQEAPITDNVTRYLASNDQYICVMQEGAKAITVYEPNSNVAPYALDYDGETIETMHIAGSQLCVLSHTMKFYVFDLTNKTPVACDGMQLPQEHVQFLQNDSYHQELTSHHDQLLLYAYQNRPHNGISIFRFDLKDKQLSRVDSYGFHCRSVARSGGLLFLGGNHTLRVVDADNGALIQTFKLPSDQFIDELHCYKDKLYISYTNDQRILCCREVQFAPSTLQKMHKATKRWWSNVSDLAAQELNAQLLSFKKLSAKRTAED